MVTELALKLIVEAKEVKAENTISVGHCAMPFGKGLEHHIMIIAQSFGWDFKQSILNLI